jgi:CRISPR-associated exonuclease Cas4
MTRPFSEDDLLPLSALQHLMFCERQAALIHVERLWADNALTVEGSHLHRRVDDSGSRRERRGDLVILRGLALRSQALGLTGRADVVELHRCEPPLHAIREGGLPAATSFAGLEGMWRPFPVDYKRGKPKSDRCDHVQLCAQALCLEEMLGTEVEDGALFYGTNQRRQLVAFDRELRDLTAQAADHLHEMVRNRETPRAVKEAKCRRCSLVEVCMPEAMTRRSAGSYLQRLVADIAAQEGET